MRILYLDLQMGAAGDMLAAALLDLLDEPSREEFLREINAAGIPGTTVSAECIAKSGVTGTQLRVNIRGEEESVDAHCASEHPHDRSALQERHDLYSHAAEGHEHAHSREHCEQDSSAPHGHFHGDKHAAWNTGGHGAHPHDTHEHHSMEEIRGIIEGLQVSGRVRGDVLSVYERIAAAESRVHGTDVSEIHLHEVGMLDAIADITAVCALIERLAPDRIVASPVTTGYGSVRCAHGILPVPAPATALLLTGVPTRAGEIEGELCTPTGAALTAHLVTEWGTAPAMISSAVGYGMGKKEFTRLNCVRATLGETITSDATDSIETPLSVQTSSVVAKSDDLHSADATDSIAELACNLDDMTGEEIAFAAEELLRAGAVDVWTTPIQMKKSRPGVILTALCRVPDHGRIAREIFRLTTTIGIRETLHRRYVLSRSLETAETPLGAVRKKVSSGYGVTREKLEFDDLARIARQSDGEAD